MASLTLVPSEFSAPLTYQIFDEESAEWVSDEMDEH